MIALALAAASLVAAPDDVAPGPRAQEAAAGSFVRVRAAVALPVGAAPPAPATGPATRALVPLPPHQALGVATVRVNPVGGFFGSLSAFRTLGDATQRPWEPDFAWAAGWDDPRPGGLGLAWEHAGGLRWTGAGAGFDEGSLVAAWNLPLAPEWPAGVARWEARAQYGWTPRWRDAGGALWAHKHAAAIRVAVTAWERVHLWAAPWAYFAGAQQPWDPDYTWGVGVVDPAGGPGALELRFVNFAGTRWWRGAGGAGPFDGALVISAGAAY